MKGGFIISFRLLLFRKYTNMSSSPVKKRRRVDISASEKRSTQADILVTVERSTVSDILKNKAKWLAVTKDCSGVLVLLKQESRYQMSRFLRLLRTVTPLSTTTQKVMTTKLLPVLSLPRWRKLLLAM